MLRELKDYLKITWTSEDAYLQSIITRGKEYLKDLTGTELSFATESTVNEEYRQALNDIISQVRNNPELITNEQAIELIIDEQNKARAAVETSSRTVALLLDYCRYYYNNAVEYFEENFQKQIVRLQFNEAIRVSKEVVTSEG